jgi:hypothetical protein
VRQRKRAFLFEVCRVERSEMALYPICVIGRQIIG